MKLYKKAITVRYLVALILGLVILMFILWVVFKTQKENFAIIETIKNFF